MHDDGESILSSPKAFSGCEGEDGGCGMCILVLFVLLRTPSGQTARQF